MNRAIPIVAGLLIVLVLVAFNTTFTVNFHEVAIRTRFGKPAGVESDAGLHLKAPFFIDSITKLDTRLQLIESPLETVQTSDGQQVVVQAFLLWRIDTHGDGPRVFFTSYNTLDGASDDLGKQLQGSLRAVGGFKFTDLIGTNSKLADAEQAILGDLSKRQLSGIEPVKVGINQVVLPPKTTTAVLRRMAQTQQNLANLETSRGNSEATAIQSEAASRADTIRDWAKVWAAEIQSVGDRESTRYYQMMAKETDLAVLLAWLDTLRASLAGSTTFVIDTSKQPFHLLNLDAPVDSNGIPRPPADASKPPKASVPTAGAKSD